MLRMSLISALLLTACASAPPEDQSATSPALADCMADSMLREGESLNNRFRQRAIRAHCEKMVANKPDDG